MILVKDFQWDPSPNSLDPNLTSICTGMSLINRGPTCQPTGPEGSRANVLMSDNTGHTQKFCVSASMCHYMHYIKQMGWLSWLIGLLGYKKNRFQPWKNNNCWTPCLSPSGRSCQIQRNSLNLSEKRQRNERPTTTHETNQFLCVIQAILTANVFLSVGSTLTEGDRTREIFQTWMAVNSLSAKVFIALHPVASQVKWQE